MWTKGRGYELGIAENMHNANITPQENELQETIEQDGWEMPRFMYLKQVTKKYDDGKTIINVLLMS